MAPDMTLFEYAVLVEAEMRYDKLRQQVVSKRAEMVGKLQELGYGKLSFPIMFYIEGATSYGTPRTGSCKLRILTYGSQCVMQALTICASLIQIFRWTCVNA